MMDVEIRELNLTYLMLARRLLQNDRNMAMVQMQLSEDMADFLLNLPSRKLAMLSDINQFLFCLRFNESGQLKTLTHNERDHGMGQMHASLLLTSAALAKIA